MRRRLTIAMTLVAALVAPAAAGVVRTADARLLGDPVFGDGTVAAGGKVVPWDNVVSVMGPGRAQPLSSPGAVHRAGGEVWRGEILGLSAERLALVSPWLGRREVAVADVRQLEFQALAAPAGQTPPAPGMLYRDQGEPVPGTLLWIDAARLAIDSPLGVLTLPREGAVRYVFPAAPGAVAPAAGPDEVGLTDGTVLGGRARPTAEGLRLDHPVLGPVTCRTATIRYVRRGGPRVCDLARATPTAVEATGLLGDGPVESVRTEGPARGSTAYLAAVRVQPKCAVTYATPKAAGGVTLSGEVGPVPAARGDVRLRVRAGDRVLFEREFAPGSPPVPLQVTLPPDAELVLDVDFGQRIGFPAGVLLRDPLLIAP